MGNWRTVSVAGHVGTIDAVTACALLRYDPNEGWEAAKARRAAMTAEEKADDDAVWPLRMGGGLGGLGQWLRADGTITGSGNLFERGYSIDAVEQALRVLARRFPTLAMVLHAGGENEDLDVVASFAVAGGEVYRTAPMIPRLTPLSDEVLEDRLLEQLDVPQALRPPIGASKEVRDAYTARLRAMREAVQADLRIGRLEGEGDA